MPALGDVVDFPKRASVELPEPGIVYFAGWLASRVKLRVDDDGRIVSTLRAGLPID